jgi:hypothetical protein
MGTYELCKKIPEKSSKVQSYIDYIESMGEVEKLLDVFEDKPYLNPMNFNMSEMNV